MLHPEYAAFLDSKAPRPQAVGIEPGDVVWSPFTGIGFEGVVALRKRRRFIGTELKAEYWRQASRHLDAAERGAVDLFSEAADW